MKRIRDDVYLGSQLKRPFGSSRGDSFGQSQPPGAGGAGGGGTGGASSHKLTTNDALTYLKEVKDMFQDQKEKYDMFLEVMKDFKAQRTDTAGVIARVKELFKGHNNLIFGFNTFLPKGYEITLDEEEAPPKKTVEFEEAISFVNKIKKRFQYDDHVYKSFLDILNMYRKEHKDINEVYNEVAALFDEHQDLLEEFTRFLPDTSANPSSDHVPYGRTLFRRCDEQDFVIPTSRHVQADQQRLRQYRFITSHADRDLSADRLEIDDDKVTMKVHKEHKRRVEKESRDRRNRDQDVRDLDNENDKDFNLQRFSEKKKSARRIEGFGMNANFASQDDRDALKSMYNQGFIFCEKVKERLCSSDDYQAFLKCLHIYSNGIIKRNDLQNLVTDLLGKYPDLMEEFNDFLERCENIDGFLAGVMNKKSRGSDGHLSRSAKEDKDKEHKREAESSKEKERSREKYMSKSIQELDLSNCQCCTPSYRHFPDDYPIPSASHRTKLGIQVFNDHWVSVTSGSEDYSFKHMRKNQYEESLFRCEDDRFELDILIETVSSTAKRVEDLLNNINENKTNAEAPIRIEDHFNALNLRCIERLYGDHGLDVMDILRKNPTLALAVILTRLKQKQEEWTGCRSDFNKVWAEIYAKNHYKSLDHRSFYFKQQDPKNLSAKSLIAEIKELKETKNKEEDILLAIAAKNRQPISSHLKFEYSDLSIHEDLYKLVHYSCEEVCSTKEQLNKIMKLWTAFLEPLLGVPSQPQCSEGSEDVGKARNQALNCTTSSIEAIHGSTGGDATVINPKHLKSDGNVDENTLLEAARIHGTSLANGNKLAKADCILSVGMVPDNLVCNNNSLQREKERNSVDNITDKVTCHNKQVSSSEQLATSNGTFAVEAINSHCRSILEESSGCGTTSSRPTAIISEGNQISAANADIVTSLQGGGNAKPALFENGMNTAEGTKVIPQKESVKPSKTEKEEGELSPNGDAEEDDFLYEEAAVKVMPGPSPIEESTQYQSGCRKVSCHDAEGENDADADADDEDSENISIAGKDASGSESAGDECSQGENREIDCKAESEGEAEGIADARITGDVTSLPSSKCFLLSAKPLARHVPAISPNEQRKDSRVFYGNDDFYVLFRLHQVLYNRILSAKTNSIGSEMKWKTSKDCGSLDLYARFLSALYNLLDGSADNAKFEDECRAVIGNQSYVLFTLDKLIYKLVKQLQTVTTDEMDLKLIQLYEYEKSRKAGIIDSVYYDNVRILLHDENIYRLGSISSPSQLSIQLMDSISEKPELVAVSTDPNFASYLHNDFLSIFPGKEPHGIALQRNKLRYAGLDEVSASCKAMEGVQLENGLECKIACNSSKISYVLDTEDFFFRSRKKRNSLLQRSSNHDRKKSISN